MRTPSPRATPRLSPDRLRLIPEFFSHGAVAYGFRSELWTCARGAGVIRREEFTFDYHADRLVEFFRQIIGRASDRVS